MSYLSELVCYLLNAYFNAKLQCSIYFTRARIKLTKVSVNINKVNLVLNPNFTVDKYIQQYKLGQACIIFSLGLWYQASKHGLFS